MSRKEKYLSKFLETSKQKIYWYPKMAVIGLQMIFQLLLSVISFWFILLHLIPSILLAIRSLYSENRKKWWLIPLITIITSIMVYIASAYIILYKSFIDEIYLQI